MALRVTSYSIQEKWDANCCIENMLVNIVLKRKNINLETHLSILLYLGMG